MYISCIKIVQLLLPVFLPKPTIITMQKNIYIDSSKYTTSGLDSASDYDSYNQASFLSNFGTFPSEVSPD